MKLNGEDVGYLAGFPAKVEVTDALLDGENHLEIKVDTTLVWKLKDGASTHLQISCDRNYRSTGDRDVYAILIR